MCCPQICAAQRAAAVCTRGNYRVNGNSARAPSQRTRLWSQTLDCIQSNLWSLLSCQLMRGCVGHAGAIVRMPTEGTRVALLYNALAHDRTTVVGIYARSIINEWGPRPSNSDGRRSTRFRLRVRTYDAPRLGVRCAPIGRTMQPHSPYAYRQANEIKKPLHSLHLTAPRRRQGVRPLRACQGCGGLADRVQPRRHTRPRPATGEAACQRRARQRKKSGFLEWCRLFLFVFIGSRTSLALYLSSRL